MACRICTELESSLQAARDPVAPSVLRGLTEAGERNRTQQKQEKLQKLETLLVKHRAKCQYVEREL